MIALKSFIYLCLFLYGNHCFPQLEKERVIILSDMGHDPDDEQQIVHLLTRSNEIELEGLIAVTGRFFRPDPPAVVKDLRPYLFNEIIDGYSEIYPNLLKHANDWPNPEHLYGIVRKGQSGNGMEDVWSGHSSPGSQLIIEAVINEDPRSVNIVINAGANTLAQALTDYRENHTEKELETFVAKLRVYDNSGQDDAGAWICGEFPEIFWIRSIAQNRSYAGPSNTNLGPYSWKPYAYSPDGQHEWVEAHIRKNHGALGATYPIRKVGETTHFLEGGGTIPILAFSIRGLTDMSEPSWGGWGGRFSPEKLANAPSAFGIVRVDEQRYEPYFMYSENRDLLDSWVNPADSTHYNDIYTSVWRWRQAMWNDFRARMDWCVLPYEKANHHPIAVINGDGSDQIIRLNGKIGQTINFDASNSQDPDKDKLSFHWWFYKEAGQAPYQQEIELSYTSDSSMMFKIPEDAAGKQLHLILEVTDAHPEIPLVDYRRVVVLIEDN